MGLEYLIQLIVYYATERNLRLSTIRVIKFLYLTDLYFARYNQGKTLTGWPWKFWKFGPWCVQSWQAVQDAVDRGLIEAKTYPSEFDEEDYYLFEVKLDKEPDLEASLPIYVISPLKLAIKKWGDDTHALLDHVYFETEPMDRVGRGELLDFSKAFPPEKPKQIVMNKLPSEKIQQGKELLTKMKDKFAQGRKISLELSTSQIIDESYLEAIEYLDDEDLAPGLTGRAEIKDIET